MNWVLVGLLPALTAAARTPAGATGASGRGREDRRTRRGEDRKGIQTIPPRVPEDQARRAGAPESVNHNRPPSHHIREIFRIGKCRDDYSKPRDASRILCGKDLTIAANKCPELKAFLNTILTLSGVAPL
jgi:hypothetical protein